MAYEYHNAIHISSHLYTVVEQCAVLNSINSRISANNTLAFWTITIIVNSSDISIKRKRSSLRMDFFSCAINSFICCCCFFFVFVVWPFGQVTKLKINYHFLNFSFFFLGLKGRKFISMTAGVCICKINLKFHLTDFNRNLATLCLRLSTTMMIKVVMVWCWIV